MYSAIPLSLRAGQGAAVNLLWATPTAAAPSAVIDGSLRAACSSSSLSIPGSLSVGLHTLSLSAGGKELATTLIEVQPSPLPPGGAQTFTAIFPFSGAVEWSGETGPRGETGNPGPTGDPGRRVGELSQGGVTGLRGGRKIPDAHPLHRPTPRH